MATRANKSIGQRLTESMCAAAVKEAAANGVGKYMRQWIEQNLDNHAKFNPTAICKALLGLQVKWGALAKWSKRPVANRLREAAGLIDAVIETPGMHVLNVQYLLIAAGNIFRATKSNDECAAAIARERFEQRFSSVCNDWPKAMIGAVAREEGLDRKRRADRESGMLARFGQRIEDLKSAHPHWSKQNIAAQLVKDNKTAIFQDHAEAIEALAREDKGCKGNLTLARKKFLEKKPYRAWVNAETLRRGPVASAVDDPQWRKKLAPAQAVPSRPR
jgi:hypothetical protein